MKKNLTRGINEQPPYVCWYVATFNEKVYVDYLPKFMLIIQQNLC